MNLQLRPVMEICEWTFGIGYDGVQSHINSCLFSWWVNSLAFMCLVLLTLALVESTFGQCLRNRKGWFLRIVYLGCSECEFELRKLPLALCFARTIQVSIHKIQLGEICKLWTLHFELLVQKLDRLSKLSNIHFGIVLTCFFVNAGQTILHLFNNLELYLFLRVWFEGAQFGEDIKLFAEDHPFIKAQFRHRLYLLLKESALYWTDIVEFAEMDEDCL